jgi:lipopolysaccharide export system ATP-binding protein
MSAGIIKSADLARQLGVKVSEIVDELSRIRGLDLGKGAKNIDISSEEAGLIKTLFNQDLFTFNRQDAGAASDEETLYQASVAELQEMETPVREEAAAPVKQSVLEVRELTKVYGKKAVVSKINLSVKTGEIVGLLGPNGAGKTTTFYMIVGLIKPESGDILLNGKDLSSMAMFMRARNGIGYLPQEPSIFRKLTVRQNLEAVLEIAEFDGAPRGKAEIKYEVNRLLREFNLTEFADRDGYRLSGGERRRTEIARAIAVRPTFMLFDEPFAGIDPIAIIELKKMLLYLRSKGLGILITDHNVRETLSITDKAYIINNGAVLAEGSASVLVNDPAVKEAYLGEGFRL